MNQYPCTESGAEEAESRGDAMPVAEDHGKTACNASVDAWRVTERNRKSQMQMLDIFLEIVERTFGDPDRAHTAS